MLTLTSLLSDGVVDVLVICMAVRVLGAGAKGRYSLTRLVHVLIPFSLTLSDALGFCKQYSDQPHPSQHPAVICPHPHLAAACT